MGLDLSTSRSGIAHAGITRSIMPTTGAENIARRLHEIVSVIDQAVNVERPDLTVIEGYSLGGLRGLSAARLAELGGCVRLRLFELGIPYVEVEPKRLKKFATGNGSATKEMMLEAARGKAGRGAIVNNHDEADAWFLRLMGLAHFGYVSVDAEQREIVEAVKWPIEGRVTL